MNIFIFHNDLRLNDNIGLSEALKTGKVIPIFVFTPTQILVNKINIDHKMQLILCVNHL